MIRRRECVRCGGDVYYARNWFYIGGRRRRSHHWRVGQRYKSGKGWIHDRCIRAPLREKARRSPFEGWTDKDLVEWAHGPEYDEDGYRSFIRLFGYCGMKDGQEIRDRLKRGGWWYPRRPTQCSLWTNKRRTRQRKVLWRRAKAGQSCIT